MASISAWRLGGRVLAQHLEKAELDIRVAGEEADRLFGEVRGIASQGLQRFQDDQQGPSLVLGAGQEACGEGEGVLGRAFTQVGLLELEGQLRGPLQALGGPWPPVAVLGSQQQLHRVEIPGGRAANVVGPTAVASVEQQMVKVATEERGIHVVCVQAPDLHLGWGGRSWRCLPRLVAVLRYWRGPTEQGRDQRVPVCDGRVRANVRGLKSHRRGRVQGGVLRRRRERGQHGRLDLGHGASLSSPAVSEQPGAARTGFRAPGSPRDPCLSAELGRRARSSSPELARRRRNCSRRPGELQPVKDCQQSQRTAAGPPVCSDHPAHTRACTAADRSDSNRSASVADGSRGPLIRKRRRGFTSPIRRCEAFRPYQAGPVGTRHPAWAPDGAEERRPCSSTSPNTCASPATRAPACPLPRLLMSVSSV